MTMRIFVIVAVMTTMLGCALSAPAVVMTGKSVMTGGRESVMTIPAPWMQQRPGAGGGELKPMPVDGDDV